MDQFSTTAPQAEPPLASRLDAVKAMVGDNPSAFIDYLKQTSPQFASFMQSVQGKTPEQAFAEHGLDFRQFSGLL